VKIVKSHLGEINPDLLLGFHAAVEDNIDARPSHHDAEEEHDHDDDINSVHISLEQEFVPQVLMSRLQQLVQEQEIYRVKGFVAVPNKAMRLVIQGVGQRFEQFYDRPWKTGETRQTNLVIIGRELERSRIQQMLGITDKEETPLLA
jgi:cobalamin biosynthesis protein CobW